MHKLNNPGNNPDYMEGCFNGIYSGNDTQVCMAAVGKGSVFIIMKGNVKSIQNELDCRCCFSLWLLVCYAVLTGY